MKIFIGILLATTINFLMGLIGLFIATSTFIVNLVPSDKPDFDLKTFDYVFSFCMKLLVIVALTWILNKVMPLLDKPRKRILFIFFLGSIFAIYNEVDLFWTEINYLRSVAVIFAESINWFITAFILSKFIKPKHLGAF